MEHDWNVSPYEAVQLQKNMRDLVRIEPFEGEPKLIAGADVSFDRGSPIFYAAFVVLDYATLEVIATADAVVESRFPYIPGLLSFREIPALLEAWHRLETEPDVVIFDGQGIAHPRRLGIASHMGLLIDRPTIGCAKSLLTGRIGALGEKPGSMSPLVAQGERVGTGLRTKRRVKPVYVSPGHRMDIESAVRIVRGAVRGYRLPEPTRLAHNEVNRLRRAALVKHMS